MTLNVFATKFTEQREDARERVQAKEAEKHKEPQAHELSSSKFNNQILRQIKNQFKESQQYTGPYFTLEGPKQNAIENIAKWTVKGTKLKTGSYQDKETGAYKDTFIISQGEHLATLRAAIIQDAEKYGAHPEHHELINLIDNKTKRPGSPPLVHWEPKTK